MVPLLNKNILIAGKPPLLTSSLDKPHVVFSFCTPHTPGTLSALKSLPVAFKDKTLSQHQASTPVCSYQSPYTSQQGKLN